MLNPIGLGTGLFGTVVIGSVVCLALYLIFFPVFGEGIKGLGHLRLTRESALLWLVVAIVAVLLVGAGWPAFGRAMEQAMTAPPTSTPTAPRPTLEPRPTATARPTVTPMPTPSPPGAWFYMPFPGPCSTCSDGVELPLPANVEPPDAAMVLDPVAVADYTVHLVEQIYGRSCYDGFLTDYVPVDFPSGKKGAFVSVGCSTGTYGFLLLYRVDGDHCAIYRAPLGANWGRVVLNDDKTIVRIKALDLFAGPRHGLGTVLQVTGLRHTGSSQYSSSFAIIAVTDEGMRILFTGYRQIYLGGDRTEVWTDYTYDYLDLDGDGIREILQQVHGSWYFYLNWHGHAARMARQYDWHLYHFDGTRYVLLRRYTDPLLVDALVK